MNPVGRLMRKYRRRDRFCCFKFTRTLESVWEPVPNFSSQAGKGADRLSFSNVGASVKSHKSASVFL